MKENIDFTPNQRATLSEETPVQVLRMFINNHRGRLLRIANDNFIIVPAFYSDGETLASLILEINYVFSPEWTELFLSRNEKALEEISYWLLWSRKIDVSIKGRYYGN